MDPEQPTGLAHLESAALHDPVERRDRLGSAGSRLSAEIEALLQPMATDGMLTEVVATGALLARRPGA